jgi:hypothetical protein
MMLALAHLDVARANVLETRTTQEADADAARVGTITPKDADPDIPILKEAQSGIRQTAINR